MTAEKEPTITEVEIIIRHSDGTEKQKVYVGDLDHILQNLLIRDML